MAEHNTQLSTTHGCSKNPQIKKIMGKEKHMQAELQAAAFIHMPVFRPIRPVCPLASLRTGVLVLQRLRGSTAHKSCSTFPLSIRVGRYRDLIGLFLKRRPI